VATYFFMGPMIRLLSTTRWFAEHPQRFGLPASGAVGSQAGQKADRRAERAGAGA